MSKALPDYFFDANAPLGVANRFHHPGCSEGKDAALVVTRTPTGWVWYCHRCGDGSGRSLDGLSSGDLLTFMRNTKAPPPVVRTVRLPVDFTLKIPDKGRVWLYKYGINDYQMTTYQFGWSPSLSRVIMPVYQDNTLVYWQGRYIPKRVGMTAQGHTKYVNVRQMGRDNIYFLVGEETGDQIVLVEDILSSIKVGGVTNALALLYAYVPDRLMINLCKRYREVVVWLDADKGNYTHKRLLRYRDLGLPVRRVFTQRDPKCYSHDRIEEELNAVVVSYGTPTAPACIMRDA